MIVFWLACAAMVIVALLYILWPLIKVENVEDSDQLQAKMAAFKANLYELEQDVKNGNMAAEDAAPAREEIEFAILQTTNQLQEKQTHNPQANLLSLLLVCALLPTSAIILYLQLGQQQLITVDATASVPETGEAQPSVEEMVSGLAEKLKHQPNDVTGWTMLARSYMVMGNYEQAVAAYKHLYSIASDNPSVLVGYADALAMNSAGNLQGMPETLLDKALQLDPNNRAGLWLAGISAQQVGKHDVAIEHWQKLLPQLENDAQARQEIEKMMAQSREQLGLLEPVQVAAEIVSAKKSLTVNVDISDSLKSGLSPNMTVFVVARALSGPPVPLAVVRRQVGELPFKVVLDDSAAMAPIAKISDHDIVNISARVSLSGTATRQAGDIISQWLTVETTQAEAVSLTIDEVIN